MQKRTPRSPATQDILQWTVPRLVGATYGLLSKKAASPRWPEFIITAIVLKKYREKSSFWFMVFQAMKGMRKHEVAAGEAKTILARLIGSKPRDIFRLSGIYRGVMAERGPAVATAVIVEIVRITNQKRSQKVSWLRPEKKPAAVPRQMTPKGNRPKHRRNPKR